MSYAIIDNEKELCKYLNHMHCVVLTEGTVYLRSGEYAGQEAYHVVRGEYESGYALASVVDSMLKNLDAGFEVRDIPESEKYAAATLLLSIHNEEEK